MVLTIKRLSEDFDNQIRAYKDKGCLRLSTLEVNVAIKAVSSLKRQLNCLVGKTVKKGFIPFLIVFPLPLEEHADKAGLRFNSFKFDRLKYAEDFRGLPETKPYLVTNVGPCQTTGTYNDSVKQIKEKRLMAMTLREGASLFTVFHDTAIQWGCLDFLGSHYEAENVLGIPTIFRNQNMAHLGWQSAQTRNQWQPAICSERILAA